MSKIIYHVDKKQHHEYRFIPALFMNAIHQFTTIYHPELKREIICEIMQRNDNDIICEVNTPEIEGEIKIHLSNHSLVRIVLIDPRTKPEVGDFQLNEVTQKITKRSDHKLEASLDVCLKVIGIDDPTFNGIPFLNEIQCTEAVEEFNLDLNPNVIS